MSRGTYEGLPYVLDNTPWWVHDGRKGFGKHCNIFGYEDDDVSVMGGTRDLAHEPHVWRCENYADGRYRVTCAHGHTGMMLLCYGHVYMFRRRMAGMCPRCVHPPRARQIEQDMAEIMRMIPHAWPDQRPGLASRLDNLRAEMNELIARGEVRTGAPLELREVS